MSLEKGEVLLELGRISGLEATEARQEEAKI